MRFIVLYILMPLMMLFPTVTHGEAGTLNIIYTGGVAGELEPCGCSPKTDFGGFGRRAGYLTGHLEMLSPYILIDSGNFLDKDTPQGRLKAEAMVNALSIMGYDIVAISKNEKQFPHDFLSALIGKYKLPVVSDSARYRESAALTRKDVKVNLSTNPRNIREGNLNILLSDMPVSEAKGLEKWDIIILSSGEILEKPLNVNGVIIVAGYPRGGKLGILTLMIDSKGSVLNFKHKWQALGRDIKEDLNVQKILDDYNESVVKLLADDYKPPAKISYFGVSKCAECHQPFNQSWSRTRHAGAFATLKRIGKSGDPECLKCHTVGFGEEGGFHSTEKTPGLADVQCEACHGSGRNHMTDFSGPMQPVTESVCLRCHTKSQSPDFNYPAYLEKIKHK